MKAFLNTTGNSSFVGHRITITIFVAVKPKWLHLSCDVIV